MDQQALDAAAAAIMGFLSTCFYLHNSHPPQLAQLIVNAGGVAAVIDYVGDSTGNVRLPGIMMLGYVAAHSENLAMAVIVSKGVVQLAIALQEEQEDHIQVAHFFQLQISRKYHYQSSKCSDPLSQAAAAWALGQAGRHTPEHAKAVAQANVLPTLLQCYLRAGSSEDLQIKVNGCTIFLLRCRL